MKQSGFKITHGKGFHITFANGWTISVQFGPGNYCEHYDRDIVNDEVACGAEGSATAECAAWNSRGDMIDLPGHDDTVTSYSKANDVLELMNWVASQPAAEVTK